MGLVMPQNPAMPTKPSKPAAITEDRTPYGKLAESSLHEVLGYQFAQASIVTGQVFDTTVGGPMELRPVEYTVLSLVHENPGVSARQLATALAVTPPNITMWIDKLEQRGLVVRERSATDRRAQHLRTTPQGSRTARDATAAVRAAEAAQIDALTPAERAMLIELLTKVARCRPRG